jgi:AmiR/NasT family two-component response regulator
MVAANTGSIRAVVVGRQAGVAERLTAMGYEVVARLKGGREALDAAQRLTPDAVVFETELSDGLGVLAAQAVTQATPGLAAVVLSAHPAVADRAARPQWGAVSLLSLNVSEDELDADVRDAVARARALNDVAEAEVVEEAEVELDVLETHEEEPLIDLGAAVGAELEESDESLIDRAIAAVSERSGLSTGDAFRLMEQEADDNQQSLREVAVAMLGDA